MRRYRDPLSVPTRPDIGIAAISLLPIRRGVAGARVNDRDISENSHADFLPREATDRHRSSGLCEKLFLVDERAVGVRAQEILGQDLVGPLHIPMLHRMDVDALERSQHIKVASGGRIRVHGHLHGMSRWGWTLSLSPAASKVTVKA